MKIQLIRREAAQYIYNLLCDKNLLYPGWQAWPHNIDNQINKKKSYS